MQNKSTALSESTSWGKPTVSDGVIVGVRVLGEKSRNGSTYPQATRKAAHKLLEGLVVNLNHRKAGGGDRSVESRIGKIVNVREGDGGTYADFHFLTKHPMAPVIIEAAERMPDLMGFSIHGQGRVKQHKGETIVESIDTLKSVDLVADPATAKSLFESEAPEAKSCEQLVGELIAALVTEGKEDLVKDMIKFKKKLGGGGDAPDEAPAEEVPAEESWKQEYQTLKLEKNCRQLLESAKVPAEPELVESLMAMSDPDARAKYVSWHKRTRVASKPKSADPVRAEQVQETNWTQILRSR